MKLFVALVLGVLFALIACYSNNLPVFSLGSPLLVLAYGIASWYMVIPAHPRSIRDVFRGVLSFFLVVTVFRGGLMIYQLFALNPVESWLTLIFFWIVASGLLMDKLVKKTA